MPIPLHPEDEPAEAKTRGDPARALDPDADAALSRGRDALLHRLAASGRGPSS